LALCELLIGSDATSLGRSAAGQKIFCQESDVQFWPNKKGPRENIFDREKRNRGNCANSKVEEGPRSSKKVERGHEKLKELVEGRGRSPKVEGEM
jgi:hypothetical protein